ncbi:hypothetical protein JKA74_09845 [Marivirga sp. S37H4]|uniref:Phospholipase D-like domain-containing protein n=1 Tax=Marivirga aurantiaca TaxID=2802615 RepID=A0A934WYN9_9BACT|nr:phospholipase D-like domain-containing protein [Marivirga aurantiaca]MBK6265341.1 hypothetical protein [Marivirga aurantiaca]
MAEFLEGSELNLAIENLFKSANEYAVIISPFVKMHSRIKDALLTQIENQNFELIVVFGKNENDLSKSISKEDLEFCTQFSSVEIRHEPRLHAKYYANDDRAILSSMNLYDFSQNNNIEFGILTSQENKVSENLDQDSFTYFDGVIDKSKLIYKKVARFDKKLFGIKKEYNGSVVELDLIDQLFKSNASGTNNNDRTGYCIRTGIKIPFNMKRPMSEKAYESWSKYRDENYKEKYCHYSGEGSEGQTCYGRPVLKKNWKKAVA